MKLIKAQERLIYLFKCFYLYQTYIFIEKLSFLIEHRQLNQYLCFAAITVSAASIFFTRNLVLRVLTFIISFFYFFELYKFEHETHAWHFMIYVSFFLIFIDNSSRKRGLKDLFGFWAIQFVILFTYSLSGFYKFAASFFTSGNNMGYFNPEGMSNLLAYRVLENNHAIRPITQFLIEHKTISFSLGLLALFVELFSILIFFQPKLIRIWGLLLVAIHFFSLIVMDIDFQANMLCCILFLVFSPTRNLNFSNRSLSLRLLPSRTSLSK